MNEEQNINQLPKEWRWVKLGDTLDIRGGSQPPKSNFIYKPKEGYIQLLQIRDFGEKGVPTYVPLKKVTKFCKKDDIMIARYGASLGRIITGLEGAYNVALAKVIDENRLFEKKYIFYLLKTQIFQTPLKLLSRSAQNGFSKSELAHINLPLPPKATQQAIVSKIEELFSELDKGIETLQLAQQQLKTYRQAVLKWAFEGKLTDAKVKKGDLLDGWKTVLINQIGKIKGGKRLPPKHQYSEEPTDWVYIMAGNLKDGTVRNKPTFIKQETYNALANYRVTGGEVYITIVGACIGDAGIIPENIGKSILTENAAKIIELKDTYNRYLALWINSTVCQVNIKSKILSATLGKLALNRIGTLEVPLAPLQEQYSIVQGIERRFDVADKMEENITQSLQRAEALRQSILKKAFEGRLI